MATPISTSDPLLAAVATSTGITAAFLADVVDLINRSPSLLDEINQLDQTPLAGGSTARVALQNETVNGGSTTYHGAVINITTFPTYSDQALPYYGASLTAGQTQLLTPAGTFVGILSHEIGHWGDAQLGPLYSTAIGGFTIEQAVATEFASEGKAANSQFTAMSQIQGTEAAQKLPADMANGNILFEVTGKPIDDTALLQTVQSITGPDAATRAAAIVSYLGSQFWDVAVDGGTYLSTMWGGYAGSGARDDLGIDASRITGFAISEAPDGTLAGCTIQTVSPAGTALTWRIACPGAGAQQARLFDSATGTLLASVSTQLPSASGAMLLGLVADKFSFTVAADSAATVQGNDNTLTLAGGDSLSLQGAGNSVVGAAGDSVRLQAAATAVVDGGGSVELDGAGAAVTVGGAGSQIRVIGDAGAVAASGSVVTLARSIAATLTGGNDTVAAAAQDRLTLSGNADSVGGSDARILLSGAQLFSIAGSQDAVSLGGAAEGGVTVHLSGGQDSLFGGVQATALTLTLSGSDAMTSLTEGSATISGAGAGTSVFGGAARVDYGGDGGILVMGSGAASVGGGAAGMRQTVFGGAGGVLYQGGQEYADVIGGAGPCTIHAGAGGGWYEGGTSGGNYLAASGAGTVLDAGGSGDTLLGAAGGGTYLIAGRGNETLIGGNRSGESTFFLGAGGDAVVAGPGGSVIDTGSGSASIYGGGGHDQVWAGTGLADLFVAGSAGQLEIHGFRTGTDHLVTGGQAVDGAARTAAGTLFTLSSGATILLAGVDAQPGGVFV